MTDRYLIRNRNTGKYFQPMRPAFRQWVDRDQIDPADTFSSKADALTRCAGMIEAELFQVVPL